MIFGACPYCDHAKTFDVGDQPTPFWGHETCESCGKTFWEHYSRLNPLAMTEEQFAKEYSVDWEAQTITQLPSPINMPIVSVLKENLDEVVDRIIQGSTESRL